MKRGYVHLLKTGQRTRLVIQNSAFLCSLQVHQENLCFPATKYNWKEGRWSRPLPQAAPQVQMGSEDCSAFPSLSHQSLFISGPWPQINATSVTHKSQEKRREEKYVAIRYSRTFLCPKMTKGWQRITSSSMFFKDIFPVSSFNGIKKSKKVYFLNSESTHSWFTSLGWWSKTDTVLSQVTTSPHLGTSQVWFNSHQEV